MPEAGVKKAEKAKRQAIRAKARQPLPQLQLAPHQDPDLIDDHVESTSTPQDKTNSPPLKTMQDLLWSSKDQRHA